MNIEKNHAVSINYKLTNDQGEVLDQSTPDQPLVYLHGFSNIIVGLENALTGKSVGDKFQVSISPNEAYGVRNDQLVQAVPKEEFGDEQDIEIGTAFQMDTPQGAMILTVIEISDTHYVLDGNHPLAGVNLNFDVEVTEVRAATENELSHGHIHGPGCNH